MKKIVLKISALTLALMLVLPASSQITLKYNFKKGETFKQNVTSNMDLTQKIMDQEMKIKLIVTIKTTFEVKDVKDGNYIMEMKYKELKINTVMPGMGNLSFDSNTPKDVATMQDFGPMLKAIIDKPVEVVLSATGKVESIKGADKLGEAMLNSFDANVSDAVKKQLIAQFGSQFSEEHFKTLFSQNAGYFPDKPVKKGDNWNYKLSTTASNFTLDVDLIMTLKNIDGDIVTVDAKGTITTPEGLEQEINGMKTKTSLKGDQSGWVKIDKNSGWIVESEIVQNFAGDIEAMGMKVPLSVTLTTTVSDDDV
jgi:hypothetical protein